MPDGYFVYRPATNNVFVFWRAFFTDPTDLAEPVKLIERTRIYPLGKEATLTLYDALTASGLDNGQPFPSLNSHDRPLVNADGSVDVYVGPTPPPGKEANWLKTVPGKGYFTILRLYSPTEAFLDGTWKANDLEEIR